MKRKIGLSMPFRYKASVISPALLVLLVSFILNFSLIFILSMTSGIENILIQLGAGDIRIEGHYEGDVEADVFHVREAGSLSFSEAGSMPLYLKGVDFSSYFTSERIKLLHLEYSSAQDVINPVIISDKIASELELSFSDRFSILIYEEDRTRSRPILATVVGIYDSGYTEFDQSLCYVPFSALNGSEYTEIVLFNHDDLDVTLTSLIASGYAAISYKTLYAPIYDNLNLSVTVLYGVFVLLALLASFFAGNISFSYIDRDARDIALLYLSGMSHKEIKRMYVRITMSVVILAVLIGLVLSLLFSLFTPSILSALSRKGFAALDAYLTSFDIIVPVPSLLLLNILLLLFSYLSLSVALRGKSTVSIMNILSSE